VVQGVDGGEESGEGLARAGGRADQRVLAGDDRRPAPGLGLGWSIGKPPLEPHPHRRMELLEDPRRTGNSGRRQQRTHRHKCITPARSPARTRVRSAWVKASPLAATLGAAGGAAASSGYDPTRPKPTMRRAIPRASRTTWSVFTRSFAACASSMPSVPAMTQGIPRAQKSLMSAP